MLNLSENFAQLKKLFSSRNSDGLKVFAAENSQQALEYSDIKLAQFAIVAYALAKLLEKSYIVQSKRWKKFSLILLQRLSSGEQCRENALVCEDSLGAIMAEMDDLSSDLGRFVVSVVEKAKIKTATQIYAHGASIGRAIELTGADRKELLGYIGATRLPEHYESKSVNQRIAFADKLFR
ncbi:MAG: hypothetical protein Q8R15_04820 [Candidatus Micrarchaeota archaeon]|nr:hypothetical protein [Candidatus Micrarchaeota archaeon]